MRLTGLMLALEDLGPYAFAPEGQELYTEESEWFGMPSCKHLFSHGISL